MNQSKCDEGYILFGATGGIGADLARRLANQGCSLFLSARNLEKLSVLANEINAQYQAADACQSGEVDSVFSKAQETLPRIGGVAYCVGSLILKPAHLTTDEEFLDTLKVNLVGAFAVLRASVKAMMREGGSIVLVSSAAARTGIANHEAISAAKAGVIGLALSAAATYAPRGIRVNVVAPGLVETPLTEQLLKNSAVRGMSERMHALKKIGKPGDVASMIAWLLSPEQAWVTGQVFGIDGGLATLKPAPEMAARSSAS